MKRSHPPSLAHAAPPLLLAVLIASLALAQAAPSRIVSLVPSVTEILFAIGAGPQVVAVSSYDHEPPEVERLPRVGALLDPDLERVLALRPDMVVIYGSQQELAQKLQAAHIGTLSYRHGGVRDVLSTIEEVGRDTGHVDGAAKVAGEISRQLDAVRARVSGRERPRVLLLFGREPLSLRGIYASGGVGFLSDLVAIAGGENVFADVARESVQAGPELILARMPDVIVELRADPMRPSDIARETAAWSALPAVPAVRNRRVVFLTGTEMVVPGPRIGRAAERLAAAIHPERR
jgi:iron complex transport system substrate-binding protein